MRWLNGQNEAYWEILRRSSMSALLWNVYSVCKGDPGRLLFIALISSFLCAQQWAAVCILMAEAWSIPLHCQATKTILKKQKKKDPYNYIQDETLVPKQFIAKKKKKYVLRISFSMQAFFGKIIKTYIFVTYTNNWYTQNCSCSFGKCCGWAVV